LRLPHMHSASHFDTSACRDVALLGRHNMPEGCPQYASTPSGNCCELHMHTCPAKHTNLTEQEIVITVNCCSDSALHNSNDVCRHTT
jgi:hypothetical protein